MSHFGRVYSESQAERPERTCMRLSNPHQGLLMITSPANVVGHTNPKTLGPLIAV